MPHHDFSPPLRLRRGTSHGLRRGPEGTQTSSAEASRQRYCGQGHRDREHSCRGQVPGVGQGHPDDARQLGCSHTVGTTRALRHLLLAVGNTEGSKLGNSEICPLGA